MRIALLALYLVGSSTCAFSQPPSPPSLKGSVFLYWGYNRAQYTTSNIHFTGPDYDFILHDVIADDKPEPFSLSNYFAPHNIWIPQYNYRVGWFLNDHWSFSIGLDHMKYVVRNDQTVQLTGSIGTTRSANYAGSDTRDVKLTEDFLRYEHTDGLNLLGINADHYDRLWTSMSGEHSFYVTEGVCIGPMIPRTDVRLFGVGLNNKFHIAGYGAGAQLGAMVLLWQHFFIRAEVKAGYIELPDVLTTGTSEDRARQHFWFTQEDVVFGAIFHLGKH
jgi:hypothetical protein